MARRLKVPGIRRQVVFPFAMLLFLAATACAGGTATGAASSTPTVTPRPGGAPGTITIESRSPIVGQNGKVLVVFATPKNGAIAIARGCARITSDRFDIPPTLMTDIGTSQDACGSTAPTIFARGTYTLAAGIYGPPFSSPEKESSLTVEHSGDGPVHVTVDGASLSR